jgi:hypothetical protein
MFLITVSAHNNPVSHYCQFTQQLIPTTALTDCVFLETDYACCELRTESIHYLHKFSQKTEDRVNKNQHCFIFHTDTHKPAKPQIRLNRNSYSAKYFISHCAVQ